MTAEQEELLVAYFQSYLKKMKGSFAHGAKVLKMTGKNEMGNTFANASEMINDFIKFEKPTSQGYRFMLSENILKATDFPLPAHVKKMIYGGSEGTWSKLKNRVCNDLRGKLAKRMGVKANDVEITLNDFSP